MPEDKKDEPKDKTEQPDTVKLIEGLTATVGKLAEALNASNEEVIKRFTDMEGKMASLAQPQGTPTPTNTVPEVKSPEVIISEAMRKLGI